MANQRLELLCQTDNEQSRLGEHFENTSVSKDQYEREEAEKEMELSVALPA